LRGLEFRARVWSRGFGFVPSGEKRIVPREDDVKDVVIYEYLYVYMCTCVYVHVYMCICVCVYMCICVYVDMFICVHVCVFSPREVNIMKGFAPREVDVKDVVEQSPKSLSLRIRPADPHDFPNSSIPSPDVSD